MEKYGKDKSTKKINGPHIHQHKNNKAKNLFFKYAEVEVFF